MQPFAWADFGAGAEARLLAIARRAIESGSDAVGPPRIELDDCEDCLKAKAAAFVTLTQKGALRGCVGSLEARDALARTVAEAAFNAAFRDRRFVPLRADEFDSVQIEISVLSAMVPIQAESRQALLGQLQPGIDGLLLEDRGRRATFLPKVWEKIASPDEFLDQLFLKAGLETGHWSRHLCVHRYETHSFGEN
jgi:AmmeMemoRadiSam system protein A